MVVVAVVMTGRGKGRAAHHEQQSNNNKFLHGKNPSMILVVRNSMAPAQVTCLPEPDT
jgi:hypothetical protein